MNNMYLKKKVRYPEVGISNPYLYITKISFPSSKGLYNWCLIYLTKNIFPDMKKKKENYRQCSVLGNLARLENNYSLIRLIKFWRGIRDLGPQCKFVEHIFFFLNPSWLRTLSSRSVIKFK